MRVVFISDVAEYYGATEALLQMITLLVKNHSVEPVILTSGSGRISEFAREHGFESHAIGHTAFLKSPGNTPLGRVVKWALRPLYYARYRITDQMAMKKAEQCVDFRTVDVIHTNVNRNDIGALLAKKYGIPHVWHIREIGELEYRCVSLRKNEISFMNAHTAVFPVISQAVADHWERKGINPEKIRIIYDGVNQNKFVPGERKEHDGLRIVFCGAVNKAKGQIQLIEAMARLTPAEQKQIRVDIYGEGLKSYLAFLMGKIREYGLEEQISLRGYCDCLEKKLPDYDVGMMCSLSEGFGLVTVEYMMSQLCVIASDSGANPELVRDGACGLLYRYGDIDSLAEKLRYVLTHREEARAMGVRAREYACRYFTAERNAQEIYELYRQLTGKS